MEESLMLNNGTTSSNKQGAAAAKSLNHFNESNESNLKVMTGAVGGVWVEDAASGDFVCTKQFDDSISPDDDADIKKLTDIEWKKIGFHKTGLTQLNGSQ